MMVLEVLLELKAAIGSIQKAKNGLMKYYQGLNMDFGVPEGVEDLLK